MAKQPSADRHCTYCHSALAYKGLKQLHEGNSQPLLQRKMACDVYLCRACGHIELFYPSEGDDGRSTED